MSRCLTLEEYLQEFVDENTQPAGTEGITLLVTNQQAQTLGFFLINGLAGLVERMRLDSKVKTTISSQLRMTTTYNTMRILKSLLTKKESI